MAAKFPLVSIVIASYNREQSLREHCFPAIAKLNYPNYEVIVVDDCSTDRTQEFLRTCRPLIKNLIVLRNQRNRGACFSRNYGVAHAVGEIVVFMDDDVSIFPDCLDEFVKLYQADSELMAVWGCVYQYGGAWSPGEKTIGTGSLWSLRRVVFRQFRFDTNLHYFGTTACDEHDLARRIQRQGCKIITTEAAQANHYPGPAKNRQWRGLGGDLNYLYEQLKAGSLRRYYSCLLLGFWLAGKQALTRQRLEPPHHPFHQAIATPQRVLVFLRNQQPGLALRWLYYTLIAIPLKAKTRKLVDAVERQYSPRWPA